MIEIRQTAVFSRWLRELRDRRARTLIELRLDRVAKGNFGDAKSVGDGVSELRIHYGPGYRAYFLRQGNLVVVLLCGGEKGTQEQDIERAKLLARDWRS